MPLPFLVGRKRFRAREAKLPTRLTASAAPPPAAPGKPLSRVEFSRLKLADTWFLLSNMFKGGVPNFAVTVLPLLSAFARIEPAP
jgi:hypothetical protein